MLSKLSKRDKFLIMASIELSVDMMMKNKQNFDKFKEYYNIHQGRLNIYLSVLALGEFDKVINVINDASYKEIKEIINYQSNQFDKMLLENDKIESVYNLLGQA